MRFEITLALFTFILSEYGANSALDTSKLRVNLEPKKPSYQPLKTKPEDRRKLISLFPKNMVKFIATEPPVRSPNSDKTQIAIKMPALKKMPVKSTTEQSYYAPRSKTVRTPLMKVKKIIEENQAIRSTVRPNKIASIFPKNKFVREENIEQAIDIESGGKYIDSSEEENVTEDTIINESIEVTSQALPFTPVSIRKFKYSGGITRPKRDTLFEVDDLSFITNDVPLDINFVEELKMDETEFIFLNDDGDNEELQNTKDTANEDQEKYKRNVIEEEIMASTLPSFMYTGRDTLLRDEIIYKNIHE